MVIAFGIEFLDTKAKPTEQGIISTLTLAFMLVFKIFLYWFSTGIENSMEPAELSTNPDNQVAQIEAATSELSYQGTDAGEWVVTPLTPLSGRVIITELEGRDSRTGWEAHPGRTGSSNSHLGWGSQTGIGVGNREARHNRRGWGSEQGLRLARSHEGGNNIITPAWGSQSAVSDSRTDGESFRSGIDSQSQSVRTSHEAVSSSHDAVSTTSDVSGWTTASGRESRQSEMR